MGYLKAKTEHDPEHTKKLNYVRLKTFEANFGDDAVQPSKNIHASMWAMEPLDWEAEQEEIFETIRLSFDRPWEAYQEALKQQSSTYMCLFAEGYFLHHILGFDADAICRYYFAKRDDIPNRTRMREFIRGDRHTLFAEFCRIVINSEGWKNYYETHMDEAHTEVTPLDLHELFRKYVFKKIYGLEISEFVPDEIGKFNYPKLCLWYEYRYNMKLPKQFSSEELSRRWKKEIV